MFRHAPVSTSSPVSSKPPRLLSSPRMFCHTQVTTLPPDSFKTSPTSYPVRANASLNNQVVPPKSNLVPLVHVRFQNIRASALLDTGSTKNYISQDLANYLSSLKLGTILNATTFSQVANGSTFKSTSMLNIIIKISTCTWKLNFIILEKLSYPVIIGYQSLSFMGANVNCTSNNVSFNFKPTLIIPFVELPVTSQSFNFDHIQSIDPSDAHFKTLLTEFSDVLTEELGQARNYKYTVHLSDDIPVRKSPYPLAPPQAKVMREHIDDLLGKGVISPSKSPYASPAFLVKKANGGFRLCVDYRPLNKKVLMDSFPVPSIEHIFQCLKSAKVFTTLDLNSAFYQIELSEKSKDITSFVTTEGQWRFHRAPFGLSVSPSSLNRIMFDLFADLRYKFVIVFFDDLLIYSPDMESHLEHVKETLRRLRKANLTVNPKKVNFAQNELKFLGHRISSQGVATDPDKVVAIRDLPVPKNIKQLQTFIGMVGYYAKFIPDYAQIMTTLNELRKKNVKFIMESKHVQAFNKLKEALSQSPVLRFPDFEKEFILQTDASQNHIGCVLLQEFEDGLHPIQYASRRLTSAEQRYCTYEQEALACIWAMEKLKSYLSHRSFLLQTDSACLKWLIQHPRNLGRVGRWLLRISRFDFRVEHIRGQINYTADCLSRLFADTEPSEINSPATEFLNPITEVNNPLADIRLLQDQDHDLNLIKTQIRQGISHKNFAIHDSFLIRLVGRKKLRRIVIPSSIKINIIEQFHNSPMSSHPGVTKTHRAVSRRFWWSGMFNDIREYNKRCQLCLQHKPNQQPDKVVMCSNPPQAVWDKIYIDLMGPLIKSYSGNKYVLLILDSFSKWLITFAIPDSSSASIIKCLHQVFTTYGPPSNIVSDNATSFSSHKFTEFCSSWGSRLIHISPYKPSSNMVERVIRNVRSAMSILLQQKFDNHVNWDLLLDHITFANNASFHKSINNIPSKIFLSREIKFPIDLQWNLSSILEQDDPISTEQVKQILQESHERQASYYNKNRKLSSRFQIGQRVVQRLHYNSKKPNLHLKFLPRYSSARVIVEFLSPVTVKLQDPISGSIYKAHVEHLKAI